MPVADCKEVFVCFFVKIWDDDETILVDFVLERPNATCLRSARVLDSILEEVADRNIVGFWCYFRIGANGEVVCLFVSYCVAWLSNWTHRFERRPRCLGRQPHWNCIWALVDGVTCILNLEIFDAWQKRTGLLQLHHHCLFSQVPSVFGFIHFLFHWSPAKVSVFFALLDHCCLKLPQTIKILCQSIADSSFLHYSPSLATHLLNKYVIQ